MMKKLVSLPVKIVAFMIAALVASMFAVGDTYYESDGKSVNVSLTYTVLEGQLAVVNGWVGVNVRSGDSGDTRALDISSHEVQLIVPTALSAAVGNIIYIDPADITGHTIDDTSYTTTAADGLIALMKVTVAQDANDVVVGILFPTQAPELALN